MPLRVSLLFTLLIYQTNIISRIRDASRRRGYSQVRCRYRHWSCQGPDTQPGILSLAHTCCIYASTSFPCLVSPVCLLYPASQVYFYDRSIKKFISTICHTYIVHVHVKQASSIICSSSPLNAPTPSSGVPQRAHPQLQPPFPPFQASPALPASPLPQQA